MVNEDYGVDGIERLLKAVKGYGLKEFDYGDVKMRFNPRYTDYSHKNNPERPQNPYVGLKGPSKNEREPDDRDRELIGDKEMASEEEMAQELFNVEEKIKI